MVEFTTPFDIGNRGLQHAGAEMMDPVLGFTENSKAARQVAFVYGKLRQAELQRRIWTFATRRVVLRARDTNTMRLTPSLWISSTSYFAGSIVSDGNGTNWISLIQNNLNNQPNSVPPATASWEPYFGPLTVSLFDVTQSYFSGELVYTTPGDGTSLVYQSLIDGNSAVPGTATTYDPTVTYFTDQIVTFSSVAYLSLINLNLNNEPDLAPAAWLVGTTYAINQKVYNPTDGLIYSSKANGNIGNNPSTDAGAHWTNTGVLCPWTTSFVGGAGSINWLLIGGSAFPGGVGLTAINTRYPLGCGPSSQSTSNNVFRLPDGYLRLAPQNPKPGIGAGGGPSGVDYSDWLIEGDHIVSSDGGPITMRFVADMQDVTRMHTMFCEGLAARIGLEVCEPLTQSSAKIGTINKIYDRWISEAGMIDAIEDGYEDPPDDELITVRR